MVLRSEVDFSRLFNKTPQFLRGFQVKLTDFPDSSACEGATGKVVDEVQLRAIKEWRPRGSQITLAIKPKTKGFKSIPSRDPFLIAARALKQSASLLVMYYGFF
jgi:hypothetical protein